MTVDRSDVRFPSGDGECGGWLYRPAGTDGERRPVVVLAHGLGGDRHMRLDAFARRFAEAGYVALAFDYRHFGDSTGEPRRLLDIRKQRDDYRAAIAWVRGLEDVDPERVVIWGSSFAGGHALVVAAGDPRLAGAISQVPFTDGIASALTLRPATTLKVSGRGIADLAAAALRRPPVPVALSGSYGDAALMVAPDVTAGYGRLDAMSPDSGGVPARVGLAIPLDRPRRHVRKISCPVLYCISTSDSVAPSKPALRAAAHTPDATVKQYDYGHFEVYVDEPFEHLVADQLAFLRERVPVSAG